MACPTFLKSSSLVVHIIFYWSLVVSTIQIGSGVNLWLISTSKLVQTLDYSIASFIISGLMQIASIGFMLYLYCEQKAAVEQLSSLQKTPAPVVKVV